MGVREPRAEGPAHAEQKCESSAHHSWLPTGPKIQLEHLHIEVCGESSRGWALRGFVSQESMNVISELGRAQQGWARLDYNGPVTLEARLQGWSLQAAARDGPSQPATKHSLQVSVWVLGTVSVGGDGERKVT